MVTVHRLKRPKKQRVEIAIFHTSDIYKLLQKKTKLKLTDF
jgi:hypothetical protein